MHALDYLIIIAYFGVVIYIGLRVRASVHSGDDFFLSGRSLPLSPRVWRTWRLIWVHLS